MRIGDVARRAGVRVSVIRYEEEIGPVPEPERVWGRRRSDERVLRRLADRRLPGIDAPIERAQRVRQWLRAAA